MTDLGNGISDIREHVASNGGGDGNKPRENMNLGLKQVVRFQNTPQCTVIGIDHVTLSDKSNSLKYQWDTFILRAREETVDPKYHTWRIANIPNLGVHFCFATHPRKLEEIAQYHREDLSGVVKVQREGIHPTRHYMGTLDVYMLPGNIIYAVKTTNDNEAVQHYECKPHYDDPN